MRVKQQLFAITTAGLFLLVPVIAAAGSCMDGKLTCAINYIYNDTKNMTVKNVKIDYSAVIAPAVTTRTECSQVTDGTTDMTCNSYITYAYVYQIKAAYSGRIKNPGYSSVSWDVCERLCNSLGIAVYYMNGKPL